MTASSDSQEKGDAERISAEIRQRALLAASRRDLPYQTLLNLAKSYTDCRVAELAIKLLNSEVKNHIKDVIREAEILAKHGGKTTITEQDMEVAIRIVRRYGGPIEHVPDNKR